MAISFTVSYTFSPSTTISSSQVNTNTTDVASVFQGLEALTKSFAKLKVDVDPTTSLEVATKQYVDHYSAYRRPNIVFASVTTVSVESGLDGTSGDIPVLFPDGIIRTETSTTRTTFNITRNAVLTTSGAQSGLTGVTSEANNTWYALYAVKVTDSSSQWVTVGTTVMPTQANFTTLNTAYQTNGWVYLGLIRNGDQGSAPADILTFTKCSDLTLFKNLATGTNVGDTFSPGILMASTASATTLTYTYASGTSGAAIPSQITISLYHAIMGALANGSMTVAGQATGQRYGTPATDDRAVFRWTSAATDGGVLSNSAASAKAYDLTLAGFYDPVLGVGSNPLL